VFTDKCWNEITTKTKAKADPSGMTNKNGKGNDNSKNKYRVLRCTQNDEQKTRATTTANATTTARATTNCKSLAGGRVYIPTHRDETAMDGAPGKRCRAGISSLPNLRAVRRAQDEAPCGCLRRTDKAKATAGYGDLLLPSAFSAAASIAAG